MRMATKNDEDPTRGGGMGGEKEVAHGSPVALLTRYEVGKRLGKSKTWVRAHEGTLLHPICGDDGVWRFDQKEVDALDAQQRAAEAASPQGDLEARVFERLDQGASLHQLVVELRQPADTLRAIWEQWRKGFEAGRRAERNREEESREARAVEERQKDSDRAEREFLADMRAGDREWDRIMARARAWRTPQGAPPSQGTSSQQVVARPRSGGSKAGGR